jgi:hypothetical protein
VAVVSVVLREVRQPDILEGVARFLCKMADENFYGVVEIQFQEGQITLVRKQESLKPSQFLL